MEKLVLGVSNYDCGASFYLKVAKQSCDYRFASSFYVKVAKQSCDYRFASSFYVEPFS